MFFILFICLSSFFPTTLLKLQVILSFLHQDSLLFRRPQIILFDKKKKVKKSWFKLSFPLSRIVSAQIKFALLFTHSRQEKFKQLCPGFELGFLSLFSSVVVMLILASSSIAEYDWQCLDLIQNFYQCWNH